MDRYFAQINNGIVQRVIAAHTKEWCEQNLGGVWVETFMDKKYAGIGDTYDEVKDRFIKPKLFDSWVFNDTTGEYEAPEPRPADLAGKGWNEKKKKWDTLDNIKKEPK